VVNDLDFDVSENPAAAAAYKNDQRNIRKVKEATKKLQVEKDHQLRTQCPADVVWRSILSILYEQESDY
jgi:hypothetical protein